MERKDEVLRRFFAPPTPEELERRRKAAAEPLAHRVDIRPMTVTQLRRLARTEDFLDSEDYLDDDGNTGNGA